VFARPNKCAAWQRAEWDVKIPGHWVLQHFRQHVDHPAGVDDAYLDIM